MTDSNFVVGRVASHDGIHVMITRYDRRTNICQVTPLRQAIKFADEHPGKSSFVRLTELSFGLTKFFMTDALVRVPITGSSCPVDQVPSGAILDLAVGGVPLGMSSVWTITKACRITGAAGELTDFQRIKPVVRLCGEIHISVAKAADIVEFEDVFFDCKDCDSAVQCSAGANIIFRRCRFRAEGYGVMVTSSRDTGTTKVTFESCHFKGCAEAGIFANGVCRVTAINCRFVECSTAIMAVNGGRVDAKYCSIVRGTNGVIAVYTASTVDLEQCSFRNCTSSGVNIGFNGVGRMNRCLIAECGKGFEITGPQRTIAIITECVSQSGLTIECGKVDITVSRSTIEKEVFVKWDLVGNIDFDNCDVESYNIWASAKCLITIDSEPVVPRPLAEIEARVAQQRATQLSLFYLRRLKKAGVSAINCFGCQKVEPAEAQYKKCARCKKVCYCSRACQVDHWSVHRNICQQEPGQDSDAES